MTISVTLKDLAAHMGFHVVRNHRNPARTLMGLMRYDFGTVLDVGANSGQFARKMRPRFPRAAFHCFEPTPAAFGELSAWASTQQGVIPAQLALGEQTGGLELNLHRHSTASSLLATAAHYETLYPIDATQARISVKVERLDDYVAGLPSPLVDDILLKLDVQGYEAQVLRGAPKLLTKVRACIAEVILDDLYVGQSRFADIVALMEAAGLQYAGNFDQAYGADGHVIFLDAVFVRGAAGASRHPVPEPI